MSIPMKASLVLTDLNTKRQRGTGHVRNFIFSRNTSVVNGLTRESEWLSSTLHKTEGAPRLKPADGKKTNLDIMCVARGFTNDF